MKHFKVVFKNDVTPSFAIYPKDEFSKNEDAQIEMFNMDTVWDEIKDHSKMIGISSTLFVILVTLIVVCLCCCRKDKNSAVQMNKTVDVEPFNMDFDGYRPEDMTKKWVRKTRY